MVLISKAQILLLSMGINISEKFKNLSEGWQALVAICSILVVGFGFGIAFSNFVGIPDQVASNTVWIKKHERSHTVLSKKIEDQGKIVAEIDSIGSTPVIFIRSRLDSIFKSIDEIKRMQDYLRCMTVDNQPQKQCVTILYKRQEPNGD